MIGYKEVNISDVSIKEGAPVVINQSLEEIAIGMEDVVVTPKPERYDATGISAKLDRRMVTESPGSAQDIFWVIQTLPGISSGGDDSKLYVRGGSPDENLVLFDGAIVKNPFHFDMMGGGFFSIFNSRLVQNVEFYSGGFPARYGDRLSSVLKIENKEGNKERFAGEANLSMSDVNAIFEIPLKFANGSGIISVRRSYFDLAFKVVPDLATADYTGTPYFFDMDTKFDFNVSQNNKLTLSWLRSFESMIADFKKPNFTGDYAFESKNQLFGSKLVSILTPQIFSELDVYSASSSKNTSHEGTGSKENSDEYEIAIKEDISLIIPKHEFHIGGWLVRKNDKIFVDVPKEASVALESLKIDSKGNFLLTSFYLDDKWIINDKLTIASGLRYDYIDKSKENFFSPRFNLAYSWNSHMSLSFDYGWYYQSPRAFELGANKNLKSKKVESFGLGVKHQVGDEIIINLEVYNKKFSNLVTIDTSNWSFSNNGYGFGRGVEIYVQWKPFKRFFGWLSYSYSIAKRKEGTHYAEHYFSYDRPHLISLVANYSFSDVWQVGMKFRYGSGTPYTPAVAGQYDSNLKKWFPIPGGQNSARYPAYSRLDLRVTRKFEFKSMKIDTYFELLNAYNRENIVHYMYNEDYTSKEALTIFPILPVLGVSVKF
jgi:outer membrane receptor protein involved in Fe transport